MQDLFSYLDASPVSFFAVENTKKALSEAGYEALRPDERWTVKPGKKYYVQNTGSNLVAFEIPKDADKASLSFRLIGAHSDSPCFRIKPGKAVLNSGLVRLNVETYGGPIYSTWLDRPLSLAGSVSLRAESALRPKQVPVDFEEPILYIPNLAIHMNREVNKGVELNAQRDMLPLIAIGTDTEMDACILRQALAKKLGTDENDILDFDLYTYVCEKACYIGLNKDMISANRLDDLVMAHSALKALLESRPCKAIKTFVFYDNEEIGSRTVGGADSAWIALVLERIVLSLGGDKEDYLCALERSFAISADVAHAEHPAHPEKADPYTKTLMGRGPAVKMSASGSYVTRSEDYSVFLDICKRAGANVQTFVNRSDSRGGSTIGPALASWVPMRSMDMGIALLAMHSSRELCAVRDYEDTVKAFTYYYEI